MEFREGSNFGDFQVIFGLKSVYKYVVPYESTTILLAVSKKYFMEYLLKDHDAFTYITKIALKRRKALRNIAKSIEQEPEIKE